MKYNLGNISAVILKERIPFGYPKGTGGGSVSITGGGGGGGLVESAADKIYIRLDLLNVDETVKAAIKAKLDYQITDVYGLENALSAKAATSYVDAQVTALNNAIAGKENALPVGTVAQYIRGNKTLGTLDVAAVAGLQTQLTNINNAIAGKENALPVGTVAQYFRGNKTLGTLDVAAVGGLQGELNKKSNVGHGHGISEILNLETVLNTKADKGYTNEQLGNLSGQITDLNNNKLDKTEYTAADILAKLKTVDGINSGLDSDLFNGMSSDVFIYATSPSGTTDRYDNGALNIFPKSGFYRLNGSGDLQGYGLNIHIQHSHIWGYNAYNVPQLMHSGGVAIDYAGNNAAIYGYDGNNNFTGLKEIWTTRNFNPNDKLTANGLYWENNAPYKLTWNANQSVGGWARAINFEGHLNDPLQVHFGAYGSVSNDGYAFINVTPKSEQNPHGNHLGLSIWQNEIKYKNNPVFHQGNSNLNTVNWNANNLTTAGTATIGSSLTATEVITGKIKARGAVINGYPTTDLLINSWLTGVGDYTTISVVGNRQNPANIRLSQTYGLQYKPDNSGTFYDFWHALNSNLDTVTWKGYNLIASNRLISNTGILELNGTWPQIAFTSNDGTSTSRIEKFGNEFGYWPPDGSGVRYFYHTKNANLDTVTWRANTLIAKSIQSQNISPFWRHYNFANGGVRWAFGFQNSENGNNTGNDFLIWRYADNGAYLSVPFAIERNTGLTKAQNGLSVTQGLTADNITVNGTLTAAEFIVNQTRATNGNFVVTDGATISEKYTDGNNIIRLKFKETLTPFRVGDFVIIQQYNPSNSTIIKSITFKVSWIDSTGTQLTTVSGAANNAEAYTKINVGDSLVRLGNESDTTRQNSIWLYANGSESPKIDLLKGVTNSITADKIVSRLGELTGLNWQGTALSGIGLYSNLAYLENANISGQIRANSGNIGGWDIGQNELASEGRRMILNATGQILLNNLTGDNAIIRPEYTFLMNKGTGNNRAVLWLRNSVTDENVRQYGIFQNHYFNYNANSNYNNIWGAWFAEKVRFPQFEISWVNWANDSDKGTGQGSKADFENGNKHAWYIGHYEYNETINLPPNPAEGTVKLISRHGKNISVRGNGKKIYTAGNQQLDTFTMTTGYEIKMFFYGSGVWWVL